MKKYAITFFAIILLSINFSYGMGAIPELKGKIINDTNLDLSDLEIRINYVCYIPMWPQDFDAGEGSYNVSVKNDGYFHSIKRHVCLIPFASLEYYDVDLVRKNSNEILASAYNGFWQGNIHLKQLEVGKIKILNYSIPTEGYHLGILKFWMGRRCSDNTKLNVGNELYVNVKDNGEIDFNTIYTMTREQDLNHEFEYSYLLEVGFVKSGENAFTVEYSNSDDGKFFYAGEVPEINFEREIEIKK